MSISHTQYTYNLFLLLTFSFFLAGSMLSGSAGDYLCTRRDWQIQIKGELKCKFSLFASLFLSGPGYEDGHVSSQSLLIKADRFLRMISSS